MGSPYHVVRVLAGCSISTFLKYAFNLSALRFLFSISCSVSFLEGLRGRSGAMILNAWQHPVFISGGKVRCERGLG